jgi:Ni,Fe-hydrogenase III large subunit
VLGYVGRASGIDIDARRDHPYAAYHALNFKVPISSSGDVSRPEPRSESKWFVAQACRQLPAGPVRTAEGRPQPFVSAFGIVEGWRGRIVHWILTGDGGRLHRVKIVL